MSVRVGVEAELGLWSALGLEARLRAGWRVEFQGMLSW